MQDLQPDSCLLVSSLLRTPAADSHRALAMVVQERGHLYVRLCPERSFMRIAQVD